MVVLCEQTQEIMPLIYMCVASWLRILGSFYEFGSIVRVQRPNSMKKG